MTVANNYAPIRQLGNGTTTLFSGVWSMIAAAYAVITLESVSTGVRTPVTQGSNANQCTLTITNSGFTVTFNTAPTSAYYVNISRQTGLDQTDSYTTSKGFQGEVVEDSYDKLTCMVQDASYAASQSITIPVGESYTTLLPSAANRANQFLAFDASGNVTTAPGSTGGVIVSSALAPVVGASTTAAAAQLLLNGASVGGLTMVNQNGGQIAGLRNRIINGDMRIDQRHAGATVTTTGYTVDRWGNSQSVSGKVTIGQNYNSLTPPTGYGYYLGAKVTTSYTIGSGDAFTIYQAVEGYNVQDLAWGTSAAIGVTLSFWVYSSVTGNFGGSVQNNGGTRSYPFLYNIPVANTWTKIQVYIPGDTAGTWVINSSLLGLSVDFCLGCGSTYLGTANTWQAGNYQGPTGQANIIGTANATFNLTGVQLEIGTAATPFEQRSFGLEFNLCLRYYETSYTYGSPAGTATTSGAIIGVATTNGTGGIVVPAVFKQAKRALPTIVAYSPNSGASGVVYLSTGGDGSASIQGIGTNGFSLGYIAGTSIIYMQGQYTATAEL